MNVLDFLCLCALKILLEENQKSLLFICLLEENNSWKFPVCMTQLGSVQFVAKKILRSKRKKIIF